MSNPSAQSKIFVLLATVSTAIALYWLRPIVVPLAVAILVAFILAPAVNRLQWCGVPRILAVLLVVGSVLMAVTLVGGIAVKQFVDLTSDFSEYRYRIEHRLRSATESAGGVMARLNRGLESLRDNLQISESGGITKSGESEIRSDGNGPSRSAVPVRVVDNGSSMLEFLSNWFGPLVSPLATAGAVTLIAIFVLIERGGLRDRLLLLVGGGRLYDTTRAMEEASHRVSRYIRAQALINCSYGIVAGLGLLFIGLPSAILWGLTAALARYVPYIGPWVSALVPITLSFGVFDGWMRPLLTIGLFVVLELIVNNALEPWLYGFSAGVSPLGVIIGAFFWTWIWGGLGLLLATPLTVCLVVLGRHVPQLRWFDVLFGPAPELSAATRIYQRLLAFDLDEAVNLAEDYVAEHDLISCYDDVLLPVLCLAMSERGRENLDDDRKDFVIRAIQQIMQILCDDNKNQPSREYSAEIDATAGDSDNVFREHVVIIPATTDADELAGEMFAHAWRGRGHSCEVLKVNTLVSEQVDRADLPEVSAVCISAIPPHARAATSYLCKRLKSRFPTKYLAVGLWNSQFPSERDRTSILAAGADKVCSSLQEAQSTLEPLAINRAQLLSRTG